MANWTAWDYAILAVAAYVAVTVLVRLMTNRRATLLTELEQQAATAQLNAVKANAAKKTK